MAWVVAFAVTVPLACLGRNPAYRGPASEDTSEETSHTSEEANTAVESSYTSEEANTSERRDTFSGSSASGTASSLATSSSGSSGDSESAELRVPPRFGKAVALDELNSDLDDEGPTVSRDGLEIIFASNRNDEDFDLFVARRPTTDAPWDKPTLLDTLNSTRDETQPALCGGDRILLFASQHDGGRQQRMYYSTRTHSEAPWSAPEPVPLRDSDGNAWPARLSVDSLTLFYVVEDDEDLELMMSTRTALDDGFSRGTPIDALNSSDDDIRAWFDDTGELVMFTSTREGNEDLWWSTRTNDAFDPPLPVTSLNGNAAERDPWLTDGGALYYASDATGSFDLYVAPRLDDL